LNKGTHGQFTAFPSLNGYPTFIKNDTLWNVFSDRGYVDIQQERNLVDLIPVYAKGLDCGAELSAGVTLYGGPTGLYGFQGVNGSMKLVTRPYGPSLAGNGIVGATHGAGGALWIATDSLLYYRDDTTSLKSIYAPSPAKLRTIGRDSSGTLWIGQSNGLFTNLKDFSATLSASKDSVMAMAFATNYDWFLTKTSAGKFILVQLYQNSKWSALPLAGIGADSTKITKLRATSDGQLYALANGIIYRYSGLNWSTTPAVGFVTGNGNAGSFYDIDLAQNNVWSQYTTVSQYKATSWGVTSASATVANGIFNPAFSGGIFAASDTSAWFFGQASTGAYAGELVDAGIYRVSSNTKGIVESYTSDSVLHAGKAANGEHIFSDNNGGLWIVMNDGVSRMKVTINGSGSGISGRASSLTSPLASFRAGKLELSLPSAAAVRIQVLDLNGRVLERQDLGTLTAGTHAVSLSEGQGLRLVRVQAGQQSQTLRLPTF
jgi:ligand-binding sensor domain-containing protein